MLCYSYIVKFVRLGGTPKILFKKSIKDNYVKKSKCLKLFFRVLSMMIYIAVLKDS